MDEERKEIPALDVTALDTYALLGLFIGILSAQAWQHMGLRVKPGTDKIEKDFERARVAIDCILFLVDKLEPHVPDAEKNRLRTLVTDLQMNFVRLLKEK
jgi:hypothetical protein